MHTKEKKVCFYELPGMRLPIQSLSRASGQGPACFRTEDWEVLGRGSGLEAGGVCPDASCTGGRASWASLSSGTLY